MISILHTWGQTLTLHPHLHCIVPGGGLTKKQRWKQAKSNGKYLFNVKAMSIVFRGRFIAELKALLPKEMTRELLATLYKHKWVVYAKHPFGGPQSVVEYLGRYTHKIAISNHRIINYQQGNLTFSYKDYKHGGVKKEMTLGAIEFIRRLSLHILPKGFVRIRHYGILSSSAKESCVASIKEQMAQHVELYSGPVQRKAVGYDPKECPCCKKKTMETIMHFYHRGPPAQWKEMALDLMRCIGGAGITSL